MDENVEDTGSRLQIQPVTWEQLSFLLSHVAKSTDDKAMRLLSRLCDEIVFEQPASPVQA